MGFKISVEVRPSLPQVCQIHHATDFCRKRAWQELLAASEDGRAWRFDEIHSQFGGVESFIVPIQIVNRQSTGSLPRYSFFSPTPPSDG
jgi:hypothetical protein